MDERRIKQLSTLVSDLERASAALTDDERLAHDKAQASVADARRHAELREGQLRVH